MGIASEAARMYEIGNDQALWELADKVWPESAADLNSDIAEVCFFTRTAHVRHQQWAEAALWSARAMVASVISNSQRTAARLLLGEFFKVSALKQYGAARAILEEMQKLVDVNDPADPMYRIYHEKLGYSFLEERQYSKAIQHYNQALLGAVNDSRGALKVRGGLALALKLANRTDEIRNDLPSEFEYISNAAAEGGYRDVQEAAERNLRWLEGKESSWTAFEVL